MKTVTRYWGLKLWGAGWIAWSVYGLHIGEHPVIVLEYALIHALLIMYIYIRLEYT